MLITSKIEYPAILVFREKHADRFFIVNSPEDTAKVCHKILLERDEDGWYPDYDRTRKEMRETESRLRSRLKESEKSFIDLSEEEVLSLPEPVKKNALAARRSYREAVKRENAYLSEDLAFAQGVLAIKNKGEAGWSLKGNKGDRYLSHILISHRVTHQYEECYVEHSESF